MKIRLSLLVLGLAILALAATTRQRKAVTAPDSVAPRSLILTSLLAPQVALAWDHDFRLTSSTFENNSFIPSSMVFSGQLGSVCNGNNISPQLRWTPAGPETRSYVVTLYDVTAAFAHWGMYNIPPTTTELDAGATPPGNARLVLNDALIQGYSGPCPPPDIVPNGIHRYVFTVYALDKEELDLTGNLAAFPPAADGLYRGMLGHVIDQASITGLFKCADNVSMCN